MDILVAAPNMPYEGIPHAGGAYLLRHLQALHARGHRVSLIVPGTPEQLAHVDAVGDWLRVLPGPHVLAGRSRLRVLRDAIYRRSMNVPPAPSAESLRSVLRAGLVEQARRADIVELHWAVYARFARVLRRAGVTTPIVVVEHDVDLAAARHKALRFTTGYRRVLALLTSPLPGWLERRGLNCADLVLVFKDADAESLGRSRVRTPVHVIEPSLDEPAGSGSARPAHTALFTGALWRPENEEGVRWFIDEVWPMVRRRVADAALLVVGADPEPRLRAAIAAAAGVSLFANVRDIVPFYDEAAIFVAPLFVPGGLKFKVPQAMLCGLAVIATSVAAAGVVEHAPDGVFWAVADDAEAMAGAVVAAMSDPDAAASVGAAARRWSREFYSFERSMDRLVERYSRLLAGR